MNIRGLVNFSGGASRALILALLWIWSFAGPTGPAYAAGSWYVATGGNDSNTCADPDLPCASLNGAISKANPGDTIYVAIGTYTGSGPEVVLVNKHVALSGGWDPTFAAQTGMSTLDGEDTRLVVRINYDSGGEMKRFIIQNGKADGAAGIQNEGWLYLNESLVQHNTDIGDWTSEGGGIRNAVTMILMNTTVAKNTSSSGAGIFNAWGSLRINNSTVSGNIASGHGGGINNLGGDIEIFSSTISRNTDSAGAGGIHNESGGTVEIKNTILAGNSSGWGIDCNGSLLSSGYNLIGDTTQCSFAPNSGDMVNIDPRLGYLQDNGGPTPTLGLKFGSPAINHGDPQGCKDYMGQILDFDQRGSGRVQRCDIGSVESQTFLYDLFLPLTTR